MEAAAHSAGANRALRYQRIGLVLGFWLAGLGLFALRRLLVAHLYAQSQTSLPWIELSECGRLWLLLLPIACCCGALAMQICWLPRWGRALSKVALGTFVLPAMLFTWVNVDVGPHKLDAVVVNGHSYVLAVAGYARGDAIVLYEVTDFTGLSWRLVDDLVDDRGNHSLTGDEHLVLSPDGRWLLYARGGLWLDCFTLDDGRATRVEIDVDLPNNVRTTEFDPRRRSARIAVLTGLRP